MRKTRIEVRANIVVYVHVCKTARIAVDNWCNKTTDMVNSNKEAEINPTNSQWVKLSIYTKMFLTDSIYKTCCK